MGHFAAGRNITPRDSQNDWMKLKYMYIKFPLTYLSSLKHTHMGCTDNSTPPASIQWNGHRVIIMQLQTSVLCLVLLFLAAFSSLRIVSPQKIHWIGLNRLLWRSFTCTTLRLEFFAGESAFNSNKVNIYMYFRVLPKICEIKLVRNITEEVSSIDTFCKYVSQEVGQLTIKVAEDWNFLM